MGVNFMSTYECYGNNQHQKQRQQQQYPQQQLAYNSCQRKSQFADESHQRNFQQQQTLATIPKLAAKADTKQGHKQHPQRQPESGDSSINSLCDDTEDRTLHSSSVSTSTKASNSEKPILAQARNNKQKQQQQDQMHHQQQQQRYHSRQAVAAAAAASNPHHRQAALQAHHMSSLGGPQKGTPSGAGGYSKGVGTAAIVSDNMTTSSSDHTIDDLHQLARGYHHQNSSTSSRHHRHNASDKYSRNYLPPSTCASSSGGRFLLGILYTLAELLLFATIALWIYWATTHDDGFGWQNDRKQQFNTHAALMMLGFVFFNCQAMLVYRSFQCCSKIYTKILHTVLFVLATSAISLGLILGYTAQENIGAGSKPIMHFYSLHAWTGLTTVVLFVFQFVFGFISFLILLCCDSATYGFRAALLPIHKTFGLIIFSLAVATCLTGLLQTARSRLSSKLNKIDYHELAEPGIIINVIGICLISLAIIIPYIIRNLDIQKPSKSDINRRLKLPQLDMRI